MAIPQTELFSVLASYKLLLLLNSRDHNEIGMYLRRAELPAPFCSDSSVRCVTQVTFYIIIPERYYT